MPRVCRRVETQGWPRVHRSRLNCGNWPILHSSRELDPTLTVFPIRATGQILPTVIQVVYLSKSGFIRSMSSGGTVPISRPNASISSPVIKLGSSPLLFASAFTSGSFIIFANPSRRALSRSAGTPGGPKKGRPISSGSTNILAIRLYNSPIFCLSINSHTVGTLGRLGWRCCPP